MDRPAAWDLLCEHTKSESLRKHGLAVEAAMRYFAVRFEGDEEIWAVTGLLHDFDYERDPDGHPQNGKPILEQAGVPGEIVHAIQSHGDHTGVPRVTPLEKTLYAVDELSGFLLACAYVRPQGLEGLTPKSVKKKLKQPSFAAAVNREDVREGAEQLGIDFDEHVAFVIAALNERADELGVAASGTAA